MLRKISLYILTGVLLMSCSNVEILRPSGKYIVGTTIIHQEDSDRKDYFAEDNRNRVVSARIWYPTESEAKKSEPYIDKQLGKAFAGQMGVPSFLMSTGGKSFSFIDASPVKNKKFPLIVFNHGYASFMKSNMSQFQELASHGYIIVSVGHPYETSYIPYSDSSDCQLSNDIMLNMKKLNKDPDSLGKDLARYMTKIRESATFEEFEKHMYELANETEIYSMLKKSLEIWVDDSKFLISFLTEVQSSEAATELINSMDLDNIGVYGHSFGGIVSGELCMDEEINIKAGISFDAPQLLYKENYSVLQTPFAYYYSDSQKIGDSKIETSQINDPILKHSKQRSYSCTVKNSAHYDFSDMTYSRFMKAFTPMLGSIKARAMSDMLNKSLRLFFDANLKGGNIKEYERFTESLDYVEFEKYNSLMTLP